MLMSKPSRIYTMLFFCIVFPFLLIAQDIHIGVLNFQQPSLSEYKKIKKRLLGIEMTMGGKTGEQISRARDKQYLERVRAYVLEELAKDARVVLIDRKRLHLISKEKELQKSEDFLDGYIVEQGKTIGADYLLNGVLLMEKNKISLSIYSVKDKLTVASNIVSPKSNILTGSTLQKDIAKTIQELKDKVFPRLMEVVRALNDGKTIKKILLAGGGTDNLKEKETLLIYYFKEEEFKGRKMKREVTVGKGKIEEVENEDFSVLSIKKGATEIKTLLDSGERLFCKKEK